LLRRVQAMEPRVVCERAHATRDGDQQPSLTAGNVIAKGLDHPQGSHRVHIEYMGPGFVVDIAGLLPRRWLGLRIPVAIVTVADPASEKRTN
jgi:hypothetical protein